MIVPLAVVIVALGVYPQVMLAAQREDDCGQGGARPGRCHRRGRRRRRRRPHERAAVAAVKPPEIDYLGPRPLFAVLGGAVIVLMAGLFPGRFVQRVLVPAADRESPLSRRSASRSSTGIPATPSRSSRARCPPTRWRCFCRCSST
ncbi:MAG: hypothetical protein WKF40_05785 [Thermoleophilaceae bacterium]